MENPVKKPIARIKRRFEVAEENLIDPLVSEIERWKVWALVGASIFSALIMLLFL